MAKSTRLTKALIQEIIESVLAATSHNADVEALKARISAKVHDYALGRTPPKLIELTKTHPREWFKWQSEMYYSGRDDNPFVLLSGQWRIPFEPVPIASDESVFAPSGFFVDEYAEAEQLVTKHNELKTNVYTFLLSCRTVEQVIERMPELAPHIPKAAAPSYPLVAPSNLLSMLMSAGFKVSV